MAKNTFIMAKDLFDDEDLELYSDEELGQIMKAIFRYVNHGEKPEFQDKGLYYIFKRFVNFNAENEQKYQSKVEGMMKARESNSKVQTAEISDVSDNRKTISENRTEISDNRKKISDSSSDTDTDTVTVTDTVLKEKTNANALVKEKSPPTHTYGEYQHVRLKDSDVVKLQTEYGPTVTSDAIRFLDEYIEEKGYKAKNHYLSIRRWVIDALKERQQAKTVPKKSIEEINLENYRRQFEREVANEQETNIKLFGLPEPSVLAKAR